MDFFTTGFDYTDTIDFTDLVYSQSTGVQIFNLGNDHAQGLVLWVSLALLVMYHAPDTVEFFVLWVLFILKAYSQLFLLLAERFL